MRPFEIDLAHAKALHLHFQGLTKPCSSPLKAIQNLGYVQIDTISVVERAHHHVLWTRVPSYRPDHMNQLLEQRKVFEYWAHAAAYLPMSDYRFSLPLKKRFYERKKGQWTRQDREAMSEVLQVIQQEGPKMSRDFQEPKNHSGGWWQWKPAKVALERLFLIGELEVSARQGFQKVFDLPERVIPSQTNTVLPNEDEYADHIIERALGRFGVASFAEMTYLLHSQFKSRIKARLRELVAAKKLVEVKVEKIGESFFAEEKTLNKKLEVSKNIHILSPFDNSVIQRKRIKSFFDFDYQIECYVPEPKRKFGYFVLPVLQGGRFIGRIDCKAQRDQRLFEVKNWFAEPKCKAKMQSKSFKEKLQQFAQFNSCEKFQIL